MATYDSLYFFSTYLCLTESIAVAFFRWSLDRAIQDEYYYPKWLSFVTDGRFDLTKELRKLASDTAEATGELISQQFTQKNSRLRLTSPTSDETLSDRAFYGTGSRVSSGQCNFVCQGFD